MNPSKRASGSDGFSGDGSESSAPVSSELDSTELDSSELDSQELNSTELDSLGPEPVGGPLVQADIVGTAIFTVGAVIAAVSPPTFGRSYAVLSLVLFLIGCVTFLAGFWHAVQRSRVDDISLGGMLVVTHHGRPPLAVRKAFIATLALQSVVALVAAAVRPFTELAFGILVPMFGLGLSCLWGARFGRFPPRPDQNSE